MMNTTQWEEVSLRWVSSISAGGTPSRKTSEYWDEGNIPWVSSGEINQRIIKTPTEYITEKGLKESSTRYFSKGTVMVALAGQGKTKGKAGILAMDSACNQSLAGIECHESKLDPWFLLYNLESNYSQLRGIAGEARDGLNLQNLKSWRILLPPLETQKRIVSYLDCHIEDINLLVKKHQCILDSIYDKFTSLSNEYVYGRSVNSVSNDEWYREIPDIWNVTKLKNIAEIIDTKHRTADYVDEGIPIASPSEISPGRLSLSGSQQTTEEEYKDLIEGGRKPEKGDIIYSRNASVGSAALVDTNERFCMGQDLCLIRTEGSGTYLHYVLNSPPVVQQVESIRVGATFDRINVEDIRNLKITWPPIDEQERIAGELDMKIDQLNEVKKSTEQVIRLLKEKRNTLTKLAITGEIDVTDWKPPEKQEVTA